MDEIQNLTHMIFPCITENSSQAEGTLFSYFVPVRSVVERQDSNKPVPPQILDNNVIFK